MLKRALLTAVPVALIALLATSGIAQELSIGPLVGYQKATDADNGNLMFGAALRLKFSQALGVEGSINYRQEDFANDAVTVRSWPIMVTGMVYPLPILYGALGAGWYNTTFDFDNDLIENETNQEFGWHFGAGVELPLSARVKLSGDVRYTFLNYEFEEVPFEDVDSNFYVITGGLLFDLSREDRTNRDNQ
jgi:opacity protein-like surface antigen